MGWDVFNIYLRREKLKIMDCCRNLVRTIPLLLAKGTKRGNYNPADIENMPGTDDGADALRYGLVTLRDQKVPAAESPAARRLREIKEQEQKESYNYART